MVALRVVRYADVDAFEERAGSYLRAREAEHCLMIGLCFHVRRGDYEDVYFAVAERDGEVVGAAMRTPPHNVILSRIEDSRAVEAFARDVRALTPRLPGVLGDRDVAAEFVRMWEALSGQRGRLTMAQRIHATTVSNAPEGVSGSLRAANPGDVELLAAWMRAFNVDTFGDDSWSDENTARLRRRLEQGLSTLYIWEDGQPVSMAGATGPTPNGIRIGPVYTPPERRGRGYATACVAEVTRVHLAEGRRFCFLFTDLANPTSNAIYRRIGYEPVCDFDQYAFEA